MSTPAHYPLKIYCGQPLSTPFQYAISGVVVDLTGWGLRAQGRRAASPQKEVAQIEWEYATTLERASPLLVGLADALGWPAETVDEIFRVGSAL